ncbi:MAG: hypothetical protein AAF483_19600, partial [Planctomycetota bacterium]
MDSFAKLIREAAQRFALLPATSRWLAAALLAVVCVSSIWMLNVYDARAESEVLSKLSVLEMRQVTNVLDAAGLVEYKVTTEGTALAVPHAERSKYMQAIRDGNALPTTWNEARDTAFSGSVFASANLQAQQTEVAEERAFELSLRMRPQIEDALVQFSEAEAVGFGEKVRTCCIQVRGDSRKPIPPSILQNIAMTATGFFAGLKLENVTVVDINTSATNHSQATVHQPLLEAKQAWEQDYYSKIAELLASYGPVKILVDVQIDPLMA